MPSTPIHMPGTLYAKLGGSWESLGKVQSGGSLFTYDGNVSPDFSDQDGATPVGFYFGGGFGMLEGELEVLNYNNFLATVSNMGCTVAGTGATVKASFNTGIPGNSLSTLEYKFVPTFGTAGWYWPAGINTADISTILAYNSIARIPFILVFKKDTTVSPATEQFGVFSTDVSDGTYGITNW